MLESVVSSSHFILWFGFKEGETLEFIEYIRKINLWKYYVKCFLITDSHICVCMCGGRYKTHMRICPTHMGSFALEVMTEKEETNTIGLTYPRGNIIQH